ncbi:MCE family protein [Rugosimonospora africana]|uniref:ABC transporter substrate-binding protein n=1 Tax=Rugosimonospora africana TaxID=556532 RepID=A0A8J3QYI0_9ACTN|nr:MCE family protein [Rugosimonospora africana]GIH18422.1 ABC transporter substrate-binding protein [Rugosimonospora africana]
MVKLRRRLAGLAFLAALGLLVWLSVAVYDKRFVPVAMVTLETDSAGNEMLPGAEVKVRGVEIGSVRRITSYGDGARLQLAIQPGQLHLLPDNVTAQLLPTTLFGERYVALIPPAAPSPRPLADHSTISQDRSADAIELEKVLADLLPMLQAVQPQKLSVTLTAISQALKGRGTELGTTLADIDTYLRQLNPELPRLDDDISQLVAVANSYDRAAPDLVGALNDFTVTSRTLVDEQDQLRQVFQTVTTASTDLTGFLSDNRDTIIALSGHSRPTLALLAEYAPEFPCVLQQLSDFVPDVDKALGKGTSEHGLHVTLRVAQSRGAYQPGRDTPRYDATGGPHCYPTPYAPTLVSGTAPAANASPSTVDVVATDSIANTPQESEYVNELLAASLNIPPAQLPSWSSLLVGPLLRGKEVTLAP